jgi:4-amino-4-deoxy-L-arabinose transferase-like glycosyltransferase
MNGVTAPTRTKPTLRQRLFNLLSAVSLLLLVATGLMWLRGAVTADMVSYATAVDLDQRFWHRRYLYTITSGAGFLTIDYEEIHSRFGISAPNLQGAQTRSRIGNARIRDAQPLLLLNLRGPSLDQRQRTEPFSSRRHVSVTIPYWLLMLPTAILPTIWLVRFRRARARSPGGFAITTPAPSAGSTG